MKLRIFVIIGSFIIAAALFNIARADQSGKPLILQNMSWQDVRDYLKTCDMVIIPLGSTEQHGPHLPLGTDFYKAFEISKLVSAKTGVIVAPVLYTGYSDVHMGFPGTMTISPSTMENILFETAESLIKHGFRRIMYLNYHGGNNIVQSRVMHRINHNTPAIAVAVGLGGNIVKDSYSEFFDWHAGAGETSIMLHLFPELVIMSKAVMPVIRFTKGMSELREMLKTNPELYAVWQSLLAVPDRTGKKSASHELSDNGILTLGDPQRATSRLGRERIESRVNSIVSFIEAWKKAGK
jgi:creatinine amidohydrolase